MVYFTFEEVLATSGIPPATLNRRLKYIKEQDPATYHAMLRKEGRVKLYAEQTLAPILADWRAYQDRVGKQAPAAKPEPAAARQAPPKPPTPPKQTKAARSEEQQRKLTGLLETPVVIIQPDAETLAIYQQVTDPQLRERLDIAILVCHEYATGLMSLEAAAQGQGISSRMFYYWIAQHEEIAALYKKAKKKARRSRSQMIGEVAHESLLRLVQGEEWDEVTMMYESRLTPSGEVVEMPVGSKRTRKKLAPSVPATIFALTNVLNRLYQNRNHLQVGPTESQKVRDEIDKMSPAQREAEVLAVMTEAVKQQLLEQGWNPPTE